MTSQKTLSPNKVPFEVLEARTGTEEIWRDTIQPRTENIFAKRPR
jgi:hypothetical protein